MDIKRKVGIISCSGEELPAGTISRLATRRVLEALRPGTTVTLCLPLFLAGGEGEREFARRHPTIAVDGCNKLCAKRGTEMHSGPVSASLVVSEILGDGCTGCRLSSREQMPADQEAVWVVAERIAIEADQILERYPVEKEAAQSPPTATCACSRPTPAMSLEVGGRLVAINGLALIFDHLLENGLAADADCGQTLLETVRIYHPVTEEEAPLYQAALVSAYKEYWRKR